MYGFDFQTLCGILCSSTVPTTFGKLSLEMDSASLVVVNRYIISAARALLQFGAGRNKSKDRFNLSFFSILSGIMCE